MNIRDVAAAAGVSPATVSRVINPDAAGYAVRSEARQRVLETIERLGYRPNDLARALLHRRTNVVGLVIPDIFNPYYPALVRGVEDAASAAGCQVVLCNTDRNIDKANTYLDTLVKSRVDGVIVAGGGTDTTFDPQLFTAYGTKVVLVGRHNLPYPSVQVDNVGAAHEATAHVLRLGHRRVAFIAGPLPSHTVQDRLAGYRNALAGHGVGFDEQLVTEGDFREAGGYGAVQTLLDSGSLPTGIVAANDRMAFGAMTALHDRGLRVPDDVSVAGFDDVPLASYLRPALTTVAIPSYDIGQTAMEMLSESPELDTDRLRMLSTQLVIRESCGKPQHGGY